MHYIPPYQHMLLRMPSMLTSTVPALPAGSLLTGCTKHSACMTEGLRQAPRSRHSWHGRGSHAASDHWTSHAKFTCNTLMASLCSVSLMPLPFQEVVRVAAAWAALGLTVSTQFCSTAKLHGADSTVVMKSAAGLLCQSFKQQHPTARPVECQHMLQCAHGLRRGCGL